MDVNTDWVGEESDHLLEQIFLNQSIIISSLLAEKRKNQYLKTNKLFQKTLKYFQQELYQ